MDGWMKATTGRLYPTVASINSSGRRIPADSKVSFPPGRQIEFRFMSLSQGLFIYCYCCC